MMLQRIPGFAVAGCLLIVLALPGCKRGTEVSEDEQSPKETPKQIESLVYVSASVSEILAEAEKRTPPEEKLELQMASMVMRGMGLTKVDLHIVLVDGEPTPALFAPDPEGKTFKYLADNEVFKEYVSKIDDTTLKLKPAPDDAKMPGVISELRIKSTDGNIVMATSELLDQLASETWKPESSDTVELAARVQEDGMLAVVSVRPGALDAAVKKLTEDPAVKGDIGAKMMSEMVGGFFKQLAGPIDGTRTIAAGFSFGEDDQRRLSYAQSFTSDEAAEAALAWLDEPPAEEEPESFLEGVRAALTSAELEKSTKCDGDLLIVDLAWSAEQEEELGYQLGKAFGTAFDGGPSADGEPGPVVTAYTIPPDFVESVDATTIGQEVTAELGKRIFVDHVYADQTEGGGAQLTIDPLFFPNAELSSADYEVKSVKTKEGKEVLGEDDEPDGFDSELPALQFGQHDYGHFIDFPLAPVDVDALDKATIHLNVNVPTKLAVFKLTADDLDKRIEQGDASVRLSMLDRNTVRIRFTAPGELQKRYDSLELHPTFYAFDESGRALARSNPWGGGGSAGVTFMGMVDKLWVVMPITITEVAATVEVALHGGEALHLPGEPSDDVAVRYDRPKFAEYRSIEAAELADIDVELIQQGGAAWPGLYYVLPEGTPPVDGRWEVHWFGEDAPAVVDGHPNNETGACQWNAYQGVEEAHAVVGRLGISVPTGIQRLTIEKQADGEWHTPTVDQGDPIKVRIDKQNVTYSLGSAELLEVVAYDESGRSLMSGDGSNSSEEGELISFWGHPVKVELLVAHTSIDRVVPFEITKEGLDAVAFAKFREQADALRSIAGLLEKTNAAVRENWNGFDALAGWYYLHDEDGKPRELIPPEIADACPDGAERFGYEPKPFKGYYFAMLKFQTNFDGDRQPFFRFGPREFTWEKGKFELEALSQAPPLVAWSEDPALPTLITDQFGERAIHVGPTNGKPVVALPGFDELDERWQQMEFVVD